MGARARRWAVCSVALLLAAGCGSRTSDDVAVDAPTSVDTTRGASSSETYYPAFDDELPDDDTTYVAVDVYVFGGDPDQLYSVRGSRLLGWSATNEYGEAAVHGFLPVGETVVLVSVSATEPLDVDGAGAEPVPGVPSYVVEDGTSKDPHSVVFEISPDGAGAVRSGITLVELDELSRSARQLPPEQ